MISRVPSGLSLTSELVTCSQTSRSRSASYVIPLHLFAKFLTSTTVPSGVYLRRTSPGMSEERGLMVRVQDQVLREREAGRHPLDLRPFLDELVDRVRLRLDAEARFRARHRAPFRGGMVGATLIRSRGDDHGRDRVVAYLRSSEGGLAAGVLHSQGRNRVSDVRELRPRRTTATACGSSVAACRTTYLQRRRDSTRVCGRRVEKAPSAFLEPTQLPQGEAKARLGLTYFDAAKGHRGSLPAREDELSDTRQRAAASPYPRHPEILGRSESQSAVAVSCSWRRPWECSPRDELQAAIHDLSQFRSTLLSASARHR